MHLARTYHTVAERAKETPKEIPLKSGLSKQGALKTSIFQPPCSSGHLIHTCTGYSRSGCRQVKHGLFCCVHIAEGTQPWTESDSPSSGIPAQRDLNTFKNWDKTTPPSLCNIMKAGNFNNCWAGVTTVRIWGIGVLLLYCCLLQTLPSNQAGACFEKLPIFWNAYDHGENTQSFLTLYTHW